MKKNNNQINFINVPRPRPQSKDELNELIKKMIEKEGNNADLNFIDTSDITDMNALFWGSDFNGDISKWDVSNVTDMSYMFASSKFNGDISKWDVSNIRDMEAMFFKSNFNGNLHRWDVSNVKQFIYMFSGSKFNNKSIINWDIQPSALINYMCYDSKLKREYYPTAILDRL